MFHRTILVALLVVSCALQASHAQHPVSRKVTHFAQSSKNRHVATTNQVDKTSGRSLIAPQSSVAKATYDVDYDAAYVACDDCNLPCDASCTKACCQYRPWDHYSSIYGAFLYLRPRDADVSYGVPINGPITAPPANNPLQVGSVGVVDPDFQPGFFAGYNYALSNCSSIDVRYTLYESTTDDSIGTIAPNVIRSMVAHPSSTSAATDFLSASAQLELDFDLIDAVFRRRWCFGPRYAVNYVAGARYANLDQRFASRFVNNGVETVTTDIDFDGVGIRLGLEGERFSTHSQWSVFGRGYANFLAGRFRGDYVQTQAFDPTVVQTDWEAGRVVPILDVELGVAWNSRNNRWRVSGSYNFSSWLNAVKTEEFINAVQSNDFDNLDENLTFDGLAT